MNGVDRGVLSLIKFIKLVTIMKSFSLKILLPIFGIFSGFSCNSFTKIPLPNPTLEDPLTITRTTNGDYTFEFAEKGTYEVYLGDSPSSIDWSKPVFVAKETKVTRSDLPQNKRIYFGIKGVDGVKYITGERRISIHSIVNFRDLGGIPTKDGRAMQWGKIYRAGDLSNLSKKETEYFNSLGIKTIVEFRNDKEIKKKPNKLPKESVINYVRVPIGDESGNVQEALKKQVLKNRRNADFDSQAFVKNVYKEFIDDYAKQYIPLMQLLLDENNYPLLFHCTAGKDRTGLGAALIMGAVGVDKKIIMDDFMLSNYYRNDHNNKVLRKMTLLGVRQNVAQPLLEVDSTYLQGSFDQMDNNYGDMNTFLDKELGIGDQERETLKSILLTTMASEAEPTD